MKNGLSRLAAVLGVVALGASGMLGASAAAAAPQDYGNIDDSRTGSLTVHKHLHQQDDVTGDISQAPASGSFTDPVEGVRFTAYPILFDSEARSISDPLIWEALRDIRPGAACTSPTGVALPGGLTMSLGAPIELPLTDEQGAATVSLDLGIYQVCETSAPARIIDRASPFILTVPMPHEGGWVYDVHAFPKNGAVEITKSIAPQQQTGLGSVVSFPITVPVPTVDEPWTGFAVRDTLDSRLAPIATATVSANGTALPSGYFSVTASGQQLTVAFTASGLSWLNEGPNAHVGQQIVVTVSGRVTSVGDGTIVNQAELWANNPDLDSSVRPPLTSNEVKSNWGSLEVIKRAQGTSGVTGLLAGAEFEVYNAADPYGDCSEAVPTGEAIVVNGQTSFTSDRSGVISIAGLFVSDSVHDVIDATQRCYVLKETIAPAGYVLPTAPLTPVTVRIGETTPVSNADIVNTQQSVPQLPLTGGNGQIVLISLGVAAVSLALGLMLVKRRRRSTAD